MASPVRVMKFHLFNCDNTYSLDSVETLLLKMADDRNLRLLVDKRKFRLHEMTDVCGKTIPMLQMDYAVFVVHAHESRLSINEDNAGIGYAEIYKTLLRATGDKVLIVIGGDDNYRDEDEEERFVISHWARRKVASQFDEEYLDGRKSFVFSWNKGHKEIHERALEHYLDPSKKGEKFQHVPKSITVNIASGTVDDSDEEAELHFLEFGKKGLKLRYVPGPQPPPTTDVSEEDVSDDAKNPLLPRSGDDSTREKPKRKEGRKRPRPDPFNAQPEFLEGTILLDTVLRFGKISYREEDLKAWDQRWEPSEKVVRHLLQDWMCRPLGNVRFVATANGGVSYIVRPRSFCCGLRLILWAFIIITIIIIISIIVYFVDHY
ncbi:unnamed protein product [Pocillopora meandrina]|uniref:Uncharacterized protein n=1 Tax=Pocillopora meandrina TaxID=46732 RepID=A0AAU9WMS0_9CNID|nr:unnamed protein product [Pocillopora meandrina]